MTTKKNIKALLVSNGGARFYSVRAHSHLDRKAESGKAVANQNSSW